MTPTAAALDPLRRFHPLVRRWFRETLGAPSAPQERGWPAIAKGDHTLILAPTGTGKTLAAFLWELDALIRAGADAPLANAIHLLYVSPLKALNNDIQRNLERPLAELQQRFGAAGERFPEIRVAVRTGDTPASARARMLRRTPHILITTPESLHIMLTTVRGRGMFSAVRAVIVDEIHALAGTKRGSHLALTLERLEHLCAEPPQRIGLSATQKPLEEIARFLGGCEHGRAGSARPRPGATSRPPDGFRPVTIVDCGLVKTMAVSVRSPVEDLGRVGGSVWPAVTPLVLEEVRRNRTTIVFVNNRAQAEKMAARLNALAGEELALPYHGSLSRERRLSLERALKAGQVRALVSTSALELGIDIGAVDGVVQLQSPKRVASGLQRVGRAGHSLAATSRGLFVPTFRDDAMEMLAIVHAMRDGDVEPTRVVQNALDVLAQVIVAATAVEDWTSAGLFDLTRRAYPYHRLTRAAFDEVVEMLAGRYPSDVAAELDARLVWDRTTDRLSATRASRLVAVVNGGTIPDRGLYTVNLPDRTRLGELDEEFVHETRVGDVFQLGSSTWRVQSIEHDRVIVIPAPGAPARMPFWHGEYGARSVHLTERLAGLRRALADAGDDAALAGIAARYDSDTATVRTLARYVGEQRAVTGVVPDDRTLVAEHFRDETGSVRIVLHAPFGGRVNAPWGMALAQRYRDALGVDVQVQTSDDGIMLRMAHLDAPPPMELLHGLPPDEATRRITTEVGSSSLFGARFRMNAARALLLPRGNPRRRMPLWLQRLKAADLLEAVREFPSFPILVETYRDVLQDAFDLAALHAVLRELEAGRVRIHTVATEGPSPMAASLQFGFVMDWMYADDSPRAERAAAMLALDTTLLEDLLGTPGELEEHLSSALQEVLARRRGTHPSRRARTADELALLLDRAGDLTRDELAQRVSDEAPGDPLGELLHVGRIVGLEVPASAGRALRLVLVESLPRYLAAFDGIDRVHAGPLLEGRAIDAAVPEAFRHASLTREAAHRELLSRFLALAGAVDVAAVRERYDFDAAWVEDRLGELTRRGLLLRGRFGAREGDRSQQWCSRRVVEHARRRALADARREIQAVPFETFARFALTWQHVRPGAQLRDLGGVREAMRQLYGIARPPLAWRSEYLPARVRDVSPGALSQLGAGGELTWAGEGGPGPAASLRLRAVRFVRRGTEQSWLGPASDDGLSERGAAVLRHLRDRGASFFSEIQQSMQLGTHALRDALRELVVAGLATNDTVEALEAVARWRPLFPDAKGGPGNAERWLPRDFVPSADRPVVQRRVNLRRLPKWKRPDREGGEAPWPGRWSALRREPVPRERAEPEENALALDVARQWLDRYGIVARDWWRRERPPIAWRSIYRELRRMEMRGEARRGFFVQGLQGAQFALPAAVEQLRATAAAHDDDLVVLAASDPANVWSVPTSGDPFARPRDGRAVLVLRGGLAQVVSDARARSVSVRPGLDAASVTACVAALVRHVAARRGRDVIVERIDGLGAAASPHAPAFLEAGLRRTSGGLRFYAPL